MTYNNDNNYNNASRRRKRRHYIRVRYYSRKSNPAVQTLQLYAIIRLLLYAAKPRKSSLPNCSGEAKNCDTYERINIYQL